MRKGTLVILSGPSGVGKDTVIDAWRAANPKVKRVVAYTTRLPRPGEENGVDYNFVTVEDFHKLAESDHFLEFKEVHGNWYATPLKDLDQMLEAGLIAILKIDVQGALAAMKLRPDAKTIFLLPPNDEELVRRITGRGTETAEIIEKRLQNARDEINLSTHYQHRVVNADLEETVRQIEDILA